MLLIFIFYLKNSKLATSYSKLQNQSETKMIFKFQNLFKHILLIPTITISLLFGNNYSLSFDGVDNYVEVPFSSELNSFTDALSFSAWINIQGGEGAYRTVLENGNTQGFALMVGTGGDIYANVQNGSGWSSVYSGQSETLNTWHHVVMTLNNTGYGEVQTGTAERAKSQYYNTRSQALPGSRHAYSVHIADFFKNGTFNQSKDIGGYAYSDPTSFITLGVYGYNNGTTFPSGERFTGRIGVVRIYNRALSDAEILQNYNADKTRFGH